MFYVYAGAVVIVLSIAKQWRDNFVRKGMFSNAL